MNPLPHPGRKIRAMHLAVTITYPELVTAPIRAGRADYRNPGYYRPQGQLATFLGGLPEVGMLNFFTG